MHTTHRKTEIKTMICTGVTLVLGVVLVQFILLLIVVTLLATGCLAMVSSAKRGSRRHLSWVYHDTLYWTQAKSERVNHYHQLCINWWGKRWMKVRAVLSEFVS